MVIFFTKYMANGDFSEPRRCADSFSAEFKVRDTSGAQGSVSVGCLGAINSPLLGGV